MTVALQLSNDEVLPLYVSCARNEIINELG